MSGDLAELERPVAVVPDGWSVQPLSKLCSEVSERVDPGAMKAAIGSHYIGLENMGQGTGQLEDIGNVADVVSQKSRFHAGDILFGKLRPNLRKVVLPDFGGVCSTDIIVLRAKATADPAFLFQVLQSEPLVSHAVATAAGTKMPRTHARSILSFEIAAPPLDEQRRIAEVLRSMDEAIASNQQYLMQARSVRMALLQQHFHMAEWAGDETLPEGWEMPFLDTVAKRGSGHTPNKKIAGYWNGGIKWVSLQDTKKLDQVYISETAQEISEDGIKNSSAVLHPSAVVVISRDATVGRSAITVGPMAVSQHFISYRCGEALSTQYLYYWFQRMKPIFERIAAGSTIKTIGLQFFKSLRIALPPLEQQDDMASVMLDVDDGILACEASLASLQSGKAALMSDLLSGNARVLG